MKLNGEDLRKLRIAYKLTQAEVGALCDRSESLVNKIERGKYPMTYGINESINREFRLTPDKMDFLMSEYYRIMERKSKAKEGTE